MRLQAIHDNVIVQPDPTVERIGNIHIPECAQETPEMGRVISVGPEVSDLKAGNWVAYPKGHDDIRHVEHDGRAHVVMASYMVLGCVVGTATAGRYKLLPLWDRVIIRRKANPAFSPGGLLLVGVGQVRPLPEQGIIVAIGSEQTELTVGGYIVYYQYGRQLIEDRSIRKDNMRPWAFTLDGQPHVLIAFEDVGGVVE